MKEIPETNLPDLIEAASKSLLQERRKDAESRIRGLLIRQEAMSESIRTKESELKKLREKLEKSVAKMTRLSKGDWSVLAELEQEEVNQPKAQTNTQP